MVCYKLNCNLHFQGLKNAFNEALTEKFQNRYESDHDSLAYYEVSCIFQVTNFIA